MEQSGIILRNSTNLKIFKSKVTQYIQYMRQEIVSKYSAVTQGSHYSFVLLVCRRVTDESRKKK